MTFEDISFRIDIIQENLDLNYPLPPDQGTAKTRIMEQETGPIYLFSGNVIYRNRDPRDN